MTPSLCITVRFLQSMCHGRGDRAEPEWPPSPLRVFQSLVAAAAARWNERTSLEYAASALRWLERQPPPLIVAARGESSRLPYRLYVPDNVGDKVAGSWSRGGTASVAEYRTEKDVRPTHLPPGGEAVHYLWPIPDSDPDFDACKEVLFAAARSITHLGWGVDMVAANASVISEADSRTLAGERWLPCPGASMSSYRVPTTGTLNALIHKHHAFLNRISPEGGFIPVPPLSEFNVVGYRRATEPAAPAFAAFSILKTDASGFRPFDTMRRGIAVSGMLRHAASAETIANALGWSPEKVAAFVLGHGESPGESHAPVQGPRLAYIPIPSIEPRGEGRAMTVASIRRALIVVSGGQANEELRQLSRLLSGAELFAEGQSAPVAMLARIPESEKTIRRYTDKASTWATVTPMILPGYDDPRKLRVRLSTRPDSGRRPLDGTEQKALLDRLDRRIEFLLRKAIRQAGYSDELAQHAEIQWRPVGFWPGTELATNYQFPDKLRRFRRLHVRITWRDSACDPISIPGPICLGGGRFHGLGLFAAMNGQ
ncbi:MAG: type I-U CRISPR-associated protein Csb2 [Isosphaeraceae bacterium]